MAALKSETRRKKIYAMVLAVITWFSLSLQLYLATQSLINFFSYFTILCNLLIAVALTFSSLAPSSRAGIFFSKLSIQTGIALYILIVFIVYNLVLRGIVTLTGWHFFVDNLLHVVVPVLYILYWLLFRPKGLLKWNDGISWIYFPLVYLIYSLIRGSFVHWYPYPFLNAEKLGYGKVLLNIGAIVAVFLIAGLLLIITTRSIKGKKSL